MHACVCTYESCTYESCQAVAGSGGGVGAGGFQLQACKLLLQAGRLPSQASFLDLPLRHELPAAVLLRAMWAAVLSPTSSSLPDCRPVQVHLLMCGASCWQHCKDGLQLCSNSDESGTMVAVLSRSNGRCFHCNDTAMPSQHCPEKFSGKLCFLVWVMHAPAAQNC